jgi:hypothetical protein
VPNPNKGHLKTNLKRKENAERDPVGVAQDRCVRGERVADLLAGAATELGSVLAQAQADRIRVCAGNANHWVAEDLHRADTGECFNGNGTLYACGSRLCQSCVAKISSRSRRELRLAVAATKLFVGENWEFITLTMPTPVGLGLLETRAVLDRSWQLFRRRDWWLSRVRGHAKSEEFTFGRVGYHWHYHLLAASRYLNFQELRAEWTDCLRLAWLGAGLLLKCETDDGLAMVKVKRVKGRVLDEAVLEVCKYLTKSESWGAIPAADLVAVAEIPRWPRMFELAGCLREARAAAAAGAPAETEIAVESLILDTTEISDGAERETSGCDPPSVGKTSRRETWRDVALNSTRENWLIWLAGVVERTQAARRSALQAKYPAASFRDLTGQEW